MTAISTSLTPPDPDALVARIAGLQSKGTATYGEGLFPAQRTHRYLRYAIEDDSIFFTALIVYALQQVRDDLSEASQALVDAITRKAVANYPRYLNNEGYPMYNFWQTQPKDRFFPNGKLLSRFRKFRLPEDIDTTAYVYLTQPHPPADVNWLKERLIRDTNGYRRHIRNTRPQYRHLKAYSTWLGQANMPIDFDVCALSNLLLFIFTYTLPLNEYDYASIRYITSVIEAGDHHAHPFEVAPWYGNTTLILYHVARLLAAAPADMLGFSTCKDRIIKDLLHQQASTSSFMERLLCSTSLMRLGQAPCVFGYPSDLEASFEDFYFFIGSLLTSVEHALTWRLAKRSLFHVRYRCPAHALALCLEHEVYRRRFSDPVPSSATA